MTKEKRKVFNLQLNEIKKSDDPTLLPCTFIILDFDISRNNAVVPKDLALEIAPTVLNKPIVAKYHEVDEANTATDAFGDHQATIGENKYGEAALKLNTTPIGVFTSEGYVMDYTDSQGNTVEVLAADAVLWKSRFNDACDLITEWYEKGINVNTSCELIYKNFSFREGVEIIESPAWLEGHCVLNSEVRGDHGIVNPAYQNSKLLSLNQMQEFERLVAQAVVKDDKKESEIMPTFKKVFELSHGDIRSKLYVKLQEHMISKQDCYISDVYETYFIVNIYSFNEDWDVIEDKHFRIDYKKNDTDVDFNFDEKIEVTLKRDWIEVTELETLQNSLNEKSKEVETLQSKLNQVNETVETIKSEKTDLETKFNSASEKLTQLNSQVEELKPFKEKFETVQFEEALNEKKEFYSAKFSALNAMEQFSSPEVQSLIEKTVHENEESKSAILQLNSMLVEMVEVKPQNKENFFRETSSERTNLLPANDDFDSRYSN